jgi:lipooligosaccharide transport system permease protein
MTGALRIVQRNALVYRRVWRGSLFFSFLQPTLFLIAMGFGLGAFVDRGAAAIPGGVSFLAFLAPGLLASSCMQTAAFESSFPIVGKMTWRRNYDAIVATPIRVADVVLGELAWMGVRLMTVATAYTTVMFVVGAARGPLLPLAVVAAVLTGLAFSAPIMAYAATHTTSANFNAMFRFIITPLFLFSGVFFPVSLLPPVLRILAPLTPLYHGVELTRGLALQTIGPGAAVGHTAYLLALLLAGLFVAFRTFAAKLHA